MTEELPIKALDSCLFGKIEPFTKPATTLKGAKRKPSWRFLSRGKELVFTLELLLPYLRLKKPQADLILEFYTLPRWSRNKEIITKKAEICSKVKELNNGR